MTFTFFVAVALLWDPVPATTQEVHGQEPSESGGYHEAAKQDAEEHGEGFQANLVALSIVSTEAT